MHVSFARPGRPITFLLSAGFACLLALAIAGPASALPGPDPCLGDTPPAYCFESHDVTAPVELQVNKAATDTVTHGTSNDLTCGDTSCTWTGQATQSCNYNNSACGPWSYPSVVLSASRTGSGWAPNWSGCGAAGSTCTVTVDGDAGSPTTVSLGWTDTEAPQNLSLSLPAKVGPGTTISASATDNSGSVSYVWTVGGSTVPATGSSITLGQTPTEGPVSVSVTAKDAALNESAPQSGSTTYDKSVHFTVTPPAPFAKAVPVTLTFSTTDTDITTRECKLATDPAWGACTTATTFSALGANAADGAYTYYVRLTDNVGNRAVSPPQNFTLDRTLPVVTFTDGPSEGQIVGTTTATLTFSATDAHLAGVTCSIDGKVPGPCTSATTVALTNLGNGQHTARVIATDAAGNQFSKTRTFTVQVGTTTSGGVAPVTGGGDTTGGGGATTGGGGGTLATGTTPKLNVRLGFVYAQLPGKTWLTKLVLRKVPKGVKIAVSCKGKGCPKKTLRLTGKGGDVKIKPLINKRFGPGAKLIFKLSKAGMKPQTILLKIRDNKEPIAG